MASIKTTVKTEACSFSEYRIYPGRGQKYIAKDGKVYFYLSSKFASLALQKKKAAKLRWTQTWRRNNKKTKVEATQRRRYKKTIKVQKAVCGLSVEDIRNRKAYVQSIEAKFKSRDNIGIKTYSHVVKLRKAKKASVYIYTFTLSFLNNDKCFICFFILNDNSRFAGKEKDDKKKGKDDKKKNVAPVQQKKEFTKGNKLLNLAKNKMHKMMKK
ncbi:60S ribosomal protein L24, putative [Plasmodium vinckei petteri]|uniref:60S ribosomal protein L24, putative n=1 Tax=Plasmodium vinckei petteri TaxID=138298 RepID=A0A6V7TE78_PLAVN|nr:60S ribosomal protein L24, putative [Plasmodium vinckei petteri]